MEDSRMTEATSPQKVSVFGWCLRNPVEIVAALLIFVLTVMVFLQVLYRYVLHSPLAWSEEFAMFLFQWCIFIGAALAVKYGYHFHVDLVTSRLSGNGRAAIQTLSSAIMLVVAYTMIHMGIKMVLSNEYIYPTLQIRVSYAYLAFPVSGILIFIYQVPILVREIKSLRKG
jgi:TRAP-type C4-dicarboxylate transport system permease small subunit